MFFGLIYPKILIKYDELIEVFSTTSMNLIEKLNELLDLVYI